MTPRIATSLATRLNRCRWLLLALTICTLVILVTTLFVAHNAKLNILCFAAMGPLVLFPWGLFCLCVWFGPNGKYKQPNPTATTMVRIIGWLFAIFLGMYIICGAILWPLSIAA